MRKSKMIMTGTAAALMAAVCLMTGCSGPAAETTAAPAETTAAGAETQAAEGAAAESLASGETEAASAQTLSPDAIKIMALDPKLPDFGKVELGDLTGLTITAPEAQEIRDEDVVTYIEEYILDRNGKEVDDKIKEGDTANIDFKGLLDGVAFEGGTGEGYDLVIGSGTFIDGFEDGLIGAAPGEERSLNLTFPADYQAEDLAGKDVVFEVKVNSVRRPMTADDLTDEIANEYSAGEYKTAAEYREGVREALELTSVALAKGELYTNAINAAADLSRTDISDAAIEWEMDMYIQNYDKNIRNTYGAGLADLLAMYGQDYDGFRATLKEGAKLSAEKAAVVHAIAEKEGIRYNADTLKMYLDEYGYSEDTVKNSTTDAWLEETVIQYLVGKHLAENANVNKISYEEYLAAAESEAQAEEASAAETAAETAAAN